MDFYELEQDGIVIKDIRKAKKRKTWPWIIGACAAVVAATAWVVWDWMENGYIF
ncbi:hypothetical protein [Neisseria musculi]|uniref:Uncharacterized protein n=1 Tax=Neisseria musculi TaxID=1815583 RepID=A0A7H1MF90_9NEIS|nr:hypothetical protein [Neisseria musculi]QNT60305.1 hypothetical protein H7A79_1149 [Neisseria musculi]